MNTFGSDLASILSAREKERATVEVTVDVPVIKADTIKKTEPTQPETKPMQPETEPTQPETVKGE